METEDDMRGGLDIIGRARDVLSQYTRDFRGSSFPLMVNDVAIRAVLNSTLNEKLRSTQPMSWADFQNIVSVEKSSEAMKGGLQGFVVPVTYDGLDLMLKLSSLTKYGEPEAVVEPSNPIHGAQVAALNQMENERGLSVPLVLKEPIADAIVGFILGTWKFAGWLWGVPNFYGSALVTMENGEFRVENSDNGNRKGAHQALLVQRADYTYWEGVVPRGAVEPRLRLAAQKNVYPYRPEDGVVPDPSRRHLRSTRVGEISDEDRARTLRLSLLMQVISQVALLEEECLFAHLDIHENNIMLVDLDRDPDVARRALGDAERSLPVVVRTDAGDECYCVPTFGLEAMLIDFGRSSLVVNLGTERKRVLGYDFLQGTVRAPRLCRLDAPCAPTEEPSGERLEPSFAESLRCKSALSFNDDVVRMIEMLLKADDSAQLRDAIFVEAFGATNPRLSSFVEHCGRSYQHLGVWTSRRTHPWRMAMLPLFRSVAKHLEYGARLQDLTDDGTTFKTGIEPYVIDVRTQKALRATLNASRPEAAPPAERARRRV